MKKYLALALFGLIVLAPIVIFPAAAQSTAAEETVTFAVTNMTCALCPVTVRRAMESIDGVRSVEIDFEAKTATVFFDPQVATPEQIASASANAGYPASVRG